MKERGPKRRDASVIRLWFLFVAVIISFVGISIYGAGEPVPTKTDNLHKVGLGREIYASNCEVCHGIRGDGNGREAYQFKTKPTDFTRGEYEFKSTYPGSPPFSSDLYRSVTKGVRGTGMLGQLHLSDDDRWAAVEYIKSFSDRFEDRPILLSEGVVVPDLPKKTSELVSKGRRVYLDAGCDKCHGNGGRGDGPSARELQDNRGNPIQIPDLTKLPRKIANGPEDHYRMLITGLEGTPMPSYKGALDDSQLWALVYYLESIATRKTGNCIRMMGGMMDMVGEECIGMQIDMPAARARMMRRRGPGMMRGMRRE